MSKLFTVFFLKQNFWSYSGIYLWPRTWQLLSEFQTKNQCRNIGTDVRNPNWECRRRQTVLVLKFQYNKKLLYNRITFRTFCELKLQKVRKRKKTQYVGARDGICNAISTPPAHSEEIKFKIRFEVKGKTNRVWFLVR